jgi:hypothetical protein
LGDIINMSQRRGFQTHILLVLMIIPLVALAIDRFLYWVQRELFPYQYNSYGLLHRGWRSISRGLEDAKFFIVRLFLRKRGLSGAGPGPEERVAP